MAWYAITWAIWTTRNDILFIGKIWDEKQIFELLKLRVAYWVNAKWPNHNGSIGDLAGLSSEGTTPAKNKNAKEKMGWTKPLTED